MNELLYPFPYYLLPQGAEIILYGAGQIGKSYYRQLRTDGRIKVLGWIDKNYQKLQNNGMPVLGTDSIFDRKFEFIFIAIADESVAGEVIEELKCNGIERERIVWCGEEYVIDRQQQEHVRYLRGRLCHKIAGALNRNRGERKFFLMLEPEHGNLGDHAILLAEKEFFKQYFPDMPLTTITERDWRELHRMGCTGFVFPKDIIFIQGGGNFGDLWGNGEWIHQIVEAFPKNKIIMLPNTLTYKDNNEEAMIRDARFYKKQKNLYFILRDRMSYEKMCGLSYRDEEYLGCYPDMALWGMNEIHGEERQGVLLCMRRDKERTLDRQVEEEIKALLFHKNIAYRETDTVLDKRMYYDAQRKRLLEEKLGEFCSAQIVITDRLHGMIFAAVTGTPCIAFNNSTGKVESVYQWIKELDYICFVKDMQGIGGLIEALFRKKKRQYNPGVTRNQYQNMAEWIQRIVSEGK